MLIIKYLFTDDLVQSISSIISLALDIVQMG